MTKNGQLWSNLLEFKILDPICIKKVQKHYAYGILKSKVNERNQINNKESLKPILTQVFEVQKHFEENMNPLIFWYQLKIFYLSFALFHGRIYIYR